MLDWMELACCPGYRETMKAFWYVHRICSSRIRSYRTMARYMFWKGLWRFWSIQKRRPQNDFNNDMMFWENGHEMVRLHGPVWPKILWGNAAFARLLGQECVRQKKRPGLC